MTTAHTIKEASEVFPKDSKKRHHIPASAPQSIDGQDFLMFPRPINDYNTYMGGSDGNAQQRACGSPAAHRDFRYWWSIFVFMLEASALNAYILHKLHGGMQVVSHREFLRQIGLALLRNPAGQSKQRNIPSDVSRKRKYAGPEHEWRRLSNKRYCIVCTRNKTPRMPLQPISTNQRAPKRPAQTIWGYSHDACVNLAMCKPKCWDGGHVVDAQS
jgi:hypothetical protein